MCLPGTVETVRRQADERGIRFDRRTALVAGAAGAFGLAMPGQALAKKKPKKQKKQKRQKGEIADLTHVFREGFPLFLGTSDAFRPDRQVRVTVGANGFYAQTWFFWEHVGTHMDVPAHFVEGGRTSPELRLEDLIVPAVVIDVSDRARRDPDTVVTPDDLRSFERRHGRIPDGAVVCMYSGWEERVRSEARYRNVGSDGKQHFPGFGKAAAEFLLEERKVTGIGVDTMSLDHGASTTFDVHVAILGADRYGIENLRNLARIPPSGATLYVGLVPWEEGSGGPARIIATW